MKRLFCLFSALVLTFSLASCTSEQGDPEDTGAVDAVEDVGEPGELTVIFYGSGEDSAGKDLSVWSRDLIVAHKDESAPETMEIDLLGKKFSGEYLYSAVLYPATHLSHFYSSDIATFSVNAGSKTLDSFTAKYEKTDEHTSIEECTSRAKAVAKRFIDPEEYTLEVFEADEENKVTDNTFAWTKYVDGMPTNDKFSVSISIYGGGISAIGCSLVGSFEKTDENVRALRRLMKADADGALRAFIDERYKGTDHEVFVGEYSAACLPDGTVALTVRTEITRQVKDDADGETYFYPHTGAYDAFVFENE